MPKSFRVIGRLSLTRHGSVRCFATAVAIASFGLACRDISAPTILIGGTYLLSGVDGRPMPTFLSGKYSYSARDTSRVDVTGDSLQFSPTDSSVVHTLAYVRYEPGLRIVGRVTSPAHRYHVERDGTVQIDDYEFGYSATGRMIGDRLEVTEPATGHVFEYRVR